MREQLVNRALMADGVTKAFKEHLGGNRQRSTARARTCWFYLNIDPVMRASKPHRLIASSPKITLTSRAGGATCKASPGLLTVNPSTIKWNMLRTAAIVLALLFAFDQLVLDGKYTSVATKMASSIAQHIR
jgi:hypothetical protein